MIHLKDANMKSFFNEFFKMHSTQHNAKGLSGTFKFQYDDGAWLASFHDGKFVKVEKAVADAPADMFIAATNEQWEKMLDINPPPFYHSYSSAIGFHGIKADESLMHWQFEQFIMDMQLCLRRFLNGVAMETPKPAPKKPNPRIEDVTGHYVYLTIDGIEYRVYYEEAGQGIPFLLQHTAGSDGRQYRHLLNDKEFTKDFRFIAHDLPYHGKSLPPEDYPWWETEYNLTLDFLLKFYDAFIDALKLDQPAYMGCSMGGHLAPDLAYYRPEKFRACVGIGAGIRTAAEVLEVAAGTMDYTKNRYANPRVGKTSLGASMETSVPPAPMSTDNTRKEVSWEYNQGGDGVFAGDIYYYSFDHNLTGKAQDIDISKCMLYLLTGSYDPGTAPHTTQELADQVKGCKFTTMEGTGHFSMTEAYPIFRKYFKEVANEIKTLK